MKAGGPGRAKIVRILCDEPQLFMATDSNGNIIASIEIVAAGLLVNIARESVVKYREQLTEPQKLALRDACARSDLTVHRMPGLDALFFMGPLVAKIRENLNESIVSNNPNEPKRALISPKHMVLFDKYTAAYLDDPSLTCIYTLDQNEPRPSLD